MSQLFSWDFPTRTATLIASSSAGNMVAANVQNAQPSLPWRSAGLAETLNFDFGTAQRIEFYHLAAHNLSNTASVRLLFSNDNWATVLAQFDLMVGELLNSQVSLGLDNFCPCPIRDGAACITPRGQQPQLTYFPAFTGFARYMRLEITDTDNTAGYIQIGCVVAGMLWRPKYGIAFGYTAGPVINSETTESEGGAWRARRRPQHREFDIRFQALTEDDEAKVTDMIRSCDADLPLFFMAYPDKSGTPTGERHTGLCFIKSAGRPSRVNPPHRTLEMTLREAI